MVISSSVLVTNKAVRAARCAMLLMATTFIWLSALLGMVHSVSASELMQLQRLAPVLQSRESVSNHAILIRHALAPGTGDPARFKIGDCSTQRNLDEVGVEQASRIGKLLRQAGLHAIHLYTSQWCRCRDTAKGMATAWAGPGGSLAVTDLPIINSFFQTMERREPQTERLRNWLQQRTSDETLDSLAVLVTHQVNITALTGVFPASGELLVVKLDEAGTVTVVATIATL